jgi:hypothetical protein
MGIESWILKPVTMFGVTLRNKHELNRAIEDAKETQELVKQKILEWAFITEPKKFIPENHHDNVQFYIEREIKELLDDYETACINLTRLWEFEESWDKVHDKDGKCILPVDPFVLDKEYMAGDYTDAILEDGSEVPEDYWDVYQGFVKKEECSFKHIYTDDAEGFEETK